MDTWVERCAVGAVRAVGDHSEGFVDPNSWEGIPDAVSSLGDTYAEHDIHNIDINISSDED